MFLLHLFLLGGREESCIELHQSEGQAAKAHLGWLCGWTSSTQRYCPPPFPSPFLIFFFFCTSSFTNCFLLFLPLLALLFLLCYSSLLFFPFSLSVSPSPHLIHRSQWKQAVIRSANGGFSHMAVTQSSRAKLSYFIFLSSISISQLCCVRRNSVCFRWLFSQFLRMRYQMDDHIHMLNLKTPFIIHPPPLWHGYVDLWEIELPLINH